MSPYDAVGSYPTHFTLTSCEAVLFLWHFPYGCPRLPLTTVIILCCPDFPLTFKGKRSSSELSKGYYTLGSSFLLVVRVERLVDHAVG